LAGIKVFSGKQKHLHYCFHQFIYSIFILHCSHTLEITSWWSNIRLKFVCPFTIQHAVEQYSDNMWRITLSAFIVLMFSTEYFVGCMSFFFTLSCFFRPTVGAFS
jgi:hypothetical protein